MAWYWWILIIVSLAGFIYLKIKIGGTWMKKQKEKKALHKKIMGDED